MKPFHWLHEAVLKQNGAYPRISIKTGTTTMQFILNLIWDLSRSNSMAVLGREVRR